MASSNSPSQKPSDQRSKSCDTACSSNSSCFFQRRKPTNPLANSVRSSLSRSTGNSVRQRVLSAKVLKLKSVQNQLNDANFHLAEVIRENQALKRLQKRQDKALTKYEGENAELPRLIQSHEEEIRCLTEKNKMLRKNLKDLSEQLKHKNDELQSLQEQIKHYEKLDRDKHLLEREKLVEELQDVKAKLQKADSEIVLLNRKLALESKTSKQRLNIEMTKHKQCQKELAQSLVEISKLSKLLEAKDKSSNLNGRKRFSNLVQRQSTSLTSLTGTKSNLTDANSLHSTNDRTPVTEVKLQPLIQGKDDDNNEVKPFKGILKCPSENIRARLSADSKKDEEDLPSVDKLSSSGSDSSNEKEMQLSRPSSNMKLEKIEMNLQNTMRKIENGDDYSKRLGDYCQKAINSVKTCEAVIENHKEILEHAKEDTDILLKTVKNAETVEERLKLSIDKPDLIDDSFDFVGEILKEEADFRAKYDFNKKGKKKDSAVDQTDKKKLLATLRAIDNGDSIESFDGDSQGKSKLMKELFGDVSN